ncbi:MAG TPA: sulfurtransferase [Candidatus Dormibacteraeota bacterium]
MSLGPLVDGQWLAAHIGDRDLRVVDFRWYLAQRIGFDEYRRGHIPGAVFVDLEAVTGEEGGGRHPLPTGRQFEREMQRAGISSGTRVVVYDDAGGSVAARLWFLLEWFGHQAQAVLDGGLHAWPGSLEVEPPEVAAGDFTASEPDGRRVLDFAGVKSLEGLPLIDARASERYRGEKEPVDPKAGHIPGARSAPWTGNLGPGGRFRGAAELRERYAALGAEQGAVVYCGSGVNACHDLLAMRIAGLDNVRLYAGSWSDWSNRDAPVATGDDSR